MWVISWGSNNSPFPVVGLPCSALMQGGRACAYPNLMSDFVDSSSEGALTCLGEWLGALLGVVVRRGAGGRAKNNRQLVTTGKRMASLRDELPFWDVQ